MNVGATVSARITWGVGGCFFLSGFAGLLYQIAWFRQFAVVFGTSAVATAIVLASYMAGLGLGAAAAGRLLNKVTRPVLVYGLLEAGVALTALALPFLLSLAQQLFEFWFGGQVTPPPAEATMGAWFFVVFAFLVILLPTTLMGATLPLLVRYVVRRDAQIGPRTAILYGTNTLGAVFGTLAAAFVLLPRVGLAGTIYIGVLINVIVFIVTALIARTEGPIDYRDAFGDVEVIDGTPLNRFSLVLPIMLLSGAASFGYEVLWTRLLVHAMGSSVYAFSIMLAGFLIGISLGSAAAARFSWTRRSAVSAFCITQLMTGLLALLVYNWTGSLISFERTLGADAFLAVAVILPATFFIGATFPLAVKMLASTHRETGQAAARIYTWNTAGAIIGALVAGLWMLPVLGFEGTVGCLVSVNLILAIASGGIFAAGRQRWLVVLPALLIVLFTIVFPPRRPLEATRATSLQMEREYQTQELFYAVGRSTTVLVSDEGDTLSMRTNGLPEATIPIKGSPPSLNSQKWLAALPSASRPRASSMLVVGLGAGVTPEGAPPTISRIDVMELEPRVLQANRAIANRRDYDPLSDPRVSIIVNDARSALRLTNAAYDIIVSQPSHPWTAGASHLFTVEFIELAKSHLNSGGVLVQWIDSAFVDEELLRSLAATLLSVFQSVRLYHVQDGALIFLASDASLDAERLFMSRDPSLKGLYDRLSAVGLGRSEDIVAALLLDESGIIEFAAQATPSTDDRNLMAFGSRVRGDGLTTTALIKALAPLDPMVTDGRVDSAYAQHLDLRYIARKWLSSGAFARIGTLLPAVEDRPTALMIQAMALTFIGKEAEADAALRAAIERAPDDNEILFMASRRSLAALATGTASAEVRQRAEALTGSARSVIDGWQLAAMQDWRGLRALDGELALALPTDLWFPQAAQLRAEWRTKDRSSRDSAQVNRQAREIVDDALMISPSVDLYLLRSASALNLGDTDAFVESSWHVLRYIRRQLAQADRGELFLSTQERQLMANRLRGISGVMTSLAERIEAPRRDLIRAQISPLLEAIDSIELDN